MNSPKKPYTNHKPTHRREVPTSGALVMKPSARRLSMTAAQASSSRPDWPNRLVSWLN